VEDSPAALKQGVGAQKMYQLHLRDQSGSAALAGKLGKMNGVASADVVGDGVRVLAEGADGLLSEVVAAASPYGLRDMTITETSLETVFIQLTGRDLRE